MEAPLKGIRTVELSGIGPSRYCGMLLAELGADVVLVTRPGEAPRRADSVVGRGRRSVVADLKTTEGREAVLALIDDADLLIEPYRPGVAERLGIGPDVCLGRNPGLIYGRITGWGQDGPLAATAGHDINYIAITGVLHSIGRAGGPPQPPLNLVGDFGAGTMFLLTGMLAALHQRDRTGAGSVIDASITDGTLSLAGFILGLRNEGKWSDDRGSNLLDTGAPYYDVYQTADELWMAVGAIEPQFFSELLRLLAIDDAPPQDDRAQWPRLRTLIADRFRQRTRDQWTLVFAGTNACVAPVLTFAEAAGHPHIRARGSLIESDGRLFPAPTPRITG
ncbi:alpha-methylacyl-CoA racemase [Mycolicibacter terrae]|uniref:Alpha-methylacyl-CoA racemase n=1 Tax=Mycolicibacter terrae TaxID=1788 RepID=A0AAD1HWA3_9MYCO|nr:CaiB/BaiF CoA-transferase family protein [Mycolicibacter terrae]ORW98054.1 carnitine dehydratase [Mycolicibacter terrae]BBX21708.1 alpha-methylacyl-CoA racemase [Mycolicibacter terrae]SNV86468.1 alpha-methylacyl-CoA racemase Mcr [Mycolicibacter terrae]